jgi:hypothetical protein
VTKKPPATKHIGRDALLEAMNEPTRVELVRVALMTLSEPVRRLLLTEEMQRVTGSPLTYRELADRFVRAITCAPSEVAGPIAAWVIAQLEAFAAATTDQKTP